MSAVWTSGGAIKWTSPKFQSHINLYYWHPELRTKDTPPNQDSFRGPWAFITGVPLLSLTFNLIINLHHPHSGVMSSTEVTGNERW